MSISCISCISLIRNKIIQNHPTSKASLSTSKVGWKSEIAGRRIKPLVASPNTGSHYNDQVRFIQNQVASITRIGQPWNIRQQNVSSKFIQIHQSIPDSKLTWFTCRISVQNCLAAAHCCTCLTSTLGQEAQVLKENLHQFTELISRQASPSYNGQHGQHSHVQWTWKLLILAVSNPSPWLSWPSHVNPHLKFFIWGRPQASICSKRPFDSTTRGFGWGHQHAADLCKAPSCLQSSAATLVGRPSPPRRHCARGPYGASILRPVERLLRNIQRKYTDINLNATW